MKAGSTFKLMVKAGIIVAYVGLIIVLIVQALTPGSESSNISNNVGDKLNDVATEIQKPEAEIFAVESVKITSITVGGKALDLDDVSITVGQSAMIGSKVVPENANNQSLVFTSSDDEILRVYANGKITAKAEGEATITVASAESNQIYDRILIKVREVGIEGIEISNIPDEICVGDVHRLEINFTPDNSSNKSIIWKSSDEEVLKVSNTGSLTAKGEGTVTITATSYANPSLSAAVEITVLPKPDIPSIPVESLEIEAASNVGYIGSTVKLSAKFYPDEADGDTIWYSSDETVATVSQKGIVTCHKAGNVTITARCSEGIEQSISITVKEVLSESITLKIEGLRKDGDNYLIKQGESGKVIATLDKSATVQTVVFSSSDEKVAKIGQDGVIEAVSGGSTTITISTSYDGKTTEESFLLTVERITLKDTMENFYYTIRKSIGHFGAFLVLGIFGALTYYIILPKSFKGKLLSVVICLVAGFAVAGITEILQLPYFTQGRYCSFDDVLLDFAGYCTSAIPIGLIILIAHPFVLVFRGKNVK
ncbi:MAG: VanZ family protein [Clostridia bacterium]|nr:VanZ family protein [Clostridia bacterium]